MQLPLYRDLCAAVGLADAAGKLAYFNVPRAVSEVAVAEADWDDAALGEAQTMRDEVIRALRAQRYWPPSDEPPKFADGLAGVCADAADGRAEIVQRSGAQVVGEKGGGDE